MRLWVQYFYKLEARSPFKSINYKFSFHWSIIIKNLHQGLFYNKYGTSLKMPAHLRIHGTSSMVGLPSKHSPTPIRCRPRSPSGSFLGDPPLEPVDSYLSFSFHGYIRDGMFYLCSSECHISAEWVLVAAAEYLWVIFKEPCVECFFEGIHEVWW